MHKVYTNNIDFSQNVDLNITLGGRLNIKSKISKQIFI